MAEMLDDLLRPGLDIVFCGTAASRISAQTGHYYANPGNKFYRTLYAIGLTDAVLKPEQYRLLLDFGIGLTDLNKIESGMDHELARDKFDSESVRRKILQFAPKILAFTSKNGARIFLDRKNLDYGEQPEKLGGTRIFALPSTSGANASWPANEHHWQALKGALSI